MATAGDPFDADDKAVRVVAGYHPKGCLVCRSRLVERHRLTPGSWGGAYTPGNVVRLCPTHHKLLHVLICWSHTAALKRWRPHKGKGGRGLCRLVSFVNKHEPKLWLFFWRVQHPILVRRRAELAGITPPPLPPLADRLRRWRAEWDSDDFGGVDTTDVATIDDLKRYGSEP